jgi:hypothetical protein
MLRRFLLACVIALAAVAIGLAGLAAWLVYQPVKADLLIYRYVHAAEARDPAHALLYHQAYDAFLRFTRANSLHYLVHKAAGAVAAATGHAHAAQVQAGRARYHLPSHQGALRDLLAAMGDGLWRIVHRFT